MFPEPDFQKALYARLSGSAALAAAMGGTVRAYDAPPQTPTFPYIQFAESQVIDEGNECDVDLFELFSTIHVWSRDVGTVETKRIVGAVRELMNAIFPMDNFSITVAKCENSQWFRDPDGISTHGVVVFRYLISTA